MWREYSPFRGTRSVWGELERLQSEMERLYSDIKRPFVGGFPALNVYTDKEGAKVTAELPGVTIEDLEIAVTGNALTVSGARALKDTAAQYHRQEREVGAFSRSIDLPFKIDSDAVEASMTKGVLCISLPRAEEDKPRKIQVKAG